MNHIAHEPLTIFDRVTIFSDGLLFIGAPRSKVRVGRKSYIIKYTGLSASSSTGPRRVLFRQSIVVVAVAPLRLTITSGTGRRVPSCGAGGSWTPTGVGFGAPVASPRWATRIYSIWARSSRRRNTPRTTVCGSSATPRPLHPSRWAVVAGTAAARCQTRTRTPDGRRPSPRPWLCGHRATSVVVVAVVAVDVAGWTRGNCWSSPTGRGVCGGIATWCASGCWNLQHLREKSLVNRLRSNDF